MRRTTTDQTSFEQRDQSDTDNATASKTEMPPLSAQQEDIDDLTSKIEQILALECPDGMNSEAFSYVRERLRTAMTGAYESLSIPIACESMA
jgi:hypothetical protein